jgi:hypothetical protein
LLLGLLGLASVTCAGPDAGVQQAQASTSCPPLALDPTRLLRQLSLDLRGAPPAYEELEAVQRAGRVPQELIDAMLRSDAFLDQAERWHADQLWPNLNGFTLQATPVRLTSGGPNPELALDLLDAETPQATCPATGTARLTARVCCTAANPNHPACCVPRNGRYNPSDPACVAKSHGLGAMMVAYNGLGDIPLRGAAGGCDETLEYPPTRVPADDRRWLHEASGRPYYHSPRSGRTRYYYDEDEVPLPYDDWAHCPNYCRRNTGTGVGGALLQADFQPKQRMEGGRMISGDHPLAACAEGFTEVQNPCDNRTYRGLDDRVRVRREGYRLLRTYWGGDHLLKACAYDAQERTNSVYTGQSCGPRARMDPSCGCGPAGEYCMPSQGYQATLPSRAERRVREGLNDEPLRIVRSVIARDEDYFNAYTTRRSFITGPLAFMYRRQAGKVFGLELSPPAAMAQLPELPYTDEGWHEYVRGPEHAGVLTTAAYLGRFPTWRSRINQFRTMLLCRPFEPPAGGLPAPEDVCNREPNLAARCGCQHCHAAIEPLGAYWGRWAERSAMYLDPATFPATDPNCATCAITGQFCTPRCRSFYVTNPLNAEDSRYAGTLFGYLYRTPEELPRIDQGPAGLVASALSTGELQSCAVRTTWRRLVGRNLSEEETREVLPELTRQFDASQHSYRALVRVIVNAPAYRRID